MRLFFFKLLVIIPLILSLQGCETVKSLMSNDSDSSKNECEDWKDYESKDTDDDDCVDWDAAKFRSQAKKAADGGNWEKSNQNL